MNSKDFSVLFIRLLLGFVFFSAGVSKIPGASFGNLIGPTMMLDLLTEHGLRGFGALIAASQIVAGALVMSQRFSLVGLIALMPMHVGILGVTLSQNWAGTPYINAFLLLLNLIALGYEWNTMRALVEPESSKVQPSASARLFPHLALPLAGIAAAFVAALAAFLEHATLGTAAGITALILLLANVYQKPAWDRMDGLDKVVLFTFDLAALSIALIFYIRNWTQIPKFYIYAFGSWGAFAGLAFLVLLVKVWQDFSKSRLAPAKFGV